jgi:hypothetical protein
MAQGAFPAQSKECFWIRRHRQEQLAERPVSFHELLMCMRGFTARRANMDVILEKNHMADAATRAAPKINNR